MIRLPSSHAWSARESALLSASLIGGALVQAAAGRHGLVAWPAWLAMFPLFVAIRLLSAGRAAVAGALWGGAGAVFHAALGDLTASPIGLIPLVATPALFALAGAWLTRRVGFSPFVLAVLWCSLEATGICQSEARQAEWQATSRDAQWMRSSISVFGYSFAGFATGLLVGSLVATVDRFLDSARSARLAPELTSPTRKIIPPRARMHAWARDDLLAMPRAPPAIALSA